MRSVAGPGVGEKSTALSGASRASTDGARARAATSSEFCRRYERGPMILTSNQSFGSWGDVFGDRIIATAILDRVLHHAITINIRGNSYRLKDVKPVEAITT